MVSVIYCLFSNCIGAELGGHSRRRTVFDAQVERQHLVQKFFKKLNGVEGKLKLVGGEGEHEGEATNNSWTILT